MSNTSNYIQATECLQHISIDNQKIKIEDYFLLNPNQVDRQRHIDLTTECIPYRLTRNSKSGKKGDIASASISMWHAKKELFKYFNIDENFNNHKIYTCHKCEHCSTNKEFVCINTLHLYIGTSSENYNDMDPEIKKKAGKIGGKIGIAKRLTDGIHPFLDPNVGLKGVTKQIVNGTHVNLQKVQCPYSSHITNLRHIKGRIKHHFPHLKQWDEFTKEEQKSFYR